MNLKVHVVCGALSGLWFFRKAGKKVKVLDYGGKARTVEKATAEQILENLGKIRGTVVSKLK